MACSKNIDVYMRARPLSQNDNKESIIHLDESNLTLSGKRYPFNLQSLKQLSSSQVDVFNTAAKNIVDGVISGYNGTIVTYGYASSGKTYTMLGDFQDEVEKGLIPRVGDYIFEQLNSLENAETKVKIAYYEVYNAEIRDLLADSQYLRNNVKTEDVHGFKEFRIKSIGELMNELIRISILKANGMDTDDQSPRSHTVFQIVIEQKKPNITLSGKLQLVDLVGNEKTGAAVAQVLNEAKFINKSLTTLCQAISALAHRDGNVSHRNPCLTSLLKDSLGGNFHTAIILCISPTAEVESKATLEFGLWAQVIRNAVLLNESIEDKEVLYRNKQIKLNTMTFYADSLAFENDRWRSGVKVPKDQWVERMDDCHLNNSSDTSKRTVKLYVGNLPEKAQSSKLREKFEKYGEVKECDVVKNYAFVHMSEDQAKDAIEALNNSDFMGSKISVEVSRSKGRWKNGEWVPNDELLDRWDDSFNLSSYSNDSFEMTKRTIKIYVGNLPDDAESDELQEMFEKYGDVKECDVLKNYGFVHMLKKSEAKKAIEALNNSDYMGSKISVEISRSKPRQCFRCGRQGHLSEECRNVDMHSGLPMGYPTDDYGGGYQRFGMDSPYGAERALADRGFDRKRPYPDPYERRPTGSPAQDSYYRRSYDSYGYSGSSSQMPSRYDYNRDPYPYMY